MACSHAWRLTGCGVRWAVLALGLLFAGWAEAFVPSSGLARSMRAPRPVPRCAEEGGNPISRFFRELDNFVDDATLRRLGNGSSFYGKRKSGFYGEEDKARKLDPSKADPDEDYQGPTNSGYFVWRRNDDGEMQPQSRLRGTPMERLMANKGGNDKSSSGGDDGRGQN
uniref:PS II complex 12 kDa extrinsic protein n=1 Tax=Rhizochromulina marina TaxID=1034831 RepID=A0A7S2SCA4_9STRA|mmetsp:Transcript_28093/g.82277  ORF Transcript_28093/g.82277 Transcript_28093/m.82277 type:complete len:168 (+) Transcript_28093:1-504(+)